MGFELNQKMFNSHSEILGGLAFLALGGEASWKPLPT